MHKIKDKILTSERNVTKKTVISIKSINIKEHEFFEGGVKGIRYQNKLQFQLKYLNNFGTCKNKKKLLTAAIFYENKLSQQ